MSLTKERVIDSIQAECGLPKRKSAELVEALFEFIKKTLESGDDVLISGFGKFSVRNKNQRRGRNPATGKELLLDARRVVTFKCAPVLKQRINGKSR
jgi:integration host factor subunit alpha